MRDQPDLASWHAWQESPWGRLRYALAETNLLRHLPPGPLRILDIGGGDGGDALRLAAHGHRVTIADPNGAMLSVAEKRVAAAGFTETVRCLPVAAAEIEDGDFDVVLCHNVIQYLDDIAAGVRTALGPLRHGGVFSMIAVNRDSVPLITAVRRLDPATALTELDATRQRSEVFGAEFALLTAAELRGMLTDANAKVLAHYGIRSICDLQSDTVDKADPAYYADLLRLESAVTDRAPYRDIARLFQLVGTVP
ncbi:MULTISPECIES: bifunctional 2-polyprenyl-6-hydroxyphenol methylase/3-demethylubiquinol 3-O-methyltransferase UbiG [unclassified Nocardia]|uniref:class I SAM-dependent methyltransferase n=1 Tax=unclassified Nocardia TaxID=2637762 RepID=UPI001CE3B778|nr:MULTISPECIES: methyltransferase domain-containing protein [unclassified Nocardia]